MEKMHRPMCNHAREGLRSKVYLVLTYFHWQPSVFLILMCNALRWAIFMVAAYAFIYAHLGRFNFIKVIITNKFHVIKYIKQTWSINNI